MPQTLMTEFQPALFSDNELRFFLEHMGENPRVLALHEMPPGVNPVAVENFLGSCWEYEQMRQADSSAVWCGPQPLIDSITTYQEWQTRCNAMLKRGIHRPSFYAWTNEGQGIKGGVGADSGFVKTAIAPGNKRVQLLVTMNEAPEDAMLDDTGTLPDFIDASAPAAIRALIVDNDHGNLICPICDYSLNFKKGDGRSYGLARANMSKHCKQVKEDRNAHMALFSAEFSAVKTAPVAAMVVTPPSPTAQPRGDNY